MCFLPRACLRVWFVCRIPCVSDGKEPACNAGDWGLIPGSGRSPGEGHGSSFRYFCLENPINRGECGPQSTGSQGVRQDGGANTFLFHQQSYPRSPTNAIDYMVLSCNRFIAPITIVCTLASGYPGIEIKMLYYSTNFCTVKYKKSQLHGCRGIVIYASHLN